MTERAGQPPMGFVDMPGAPEVFTHGAYGFRIVAGVVSITLVSSRINHADSSEYAVVVGTVSMPAAAAQALSVGLYNFLGQHGLVPQGDERKQLQ